MSQCPVCRKTDLPFLQELGAMHFAAEKYRQERDAALARAERAEEMLRRVRHESGVEFADPRVRYVAVQIDADLWDEMAALAAGVRRTPPCLCPWPEQDPAPRHKPGCALAEGGEEVPPVSPRHTLKTWPGPFAAVLDGRKRFEIRKADRPFTDGDVLLLREWLPETESYTGREIAVRITYRVRPGMWGLPPDVVVLGIEPLAPAGEKEADRG